MKRKTRKEPIYLTLKHQVVWIISTAFAIAAALFWKDAIQQIISFYVPSSQSPVYTIYAATIVTIAAIIAIWITHIILKE